MNIDASNLGESAGERAQRVVQKRMASLGLGPIGSDLFEIFYQQPAQQRITQWQEQVTNLLEELIEVGVIVDRNSPEATGFFNAVTACARDAALAFIPDKQKAFRQLIKSSAESVGEIEAEEIEHMVEILRRTTGIHYAILQAINESSIHLGRAKLPASFPENHPVYAERKDLVSRALVDLDYLNLTEFYWLHTNTTTGEQSLLQPPPATGSSPYPWSSENCRRISSFGKRFCKFALAGK